jgi:signal transduction histidine kinase
MSTTPRTGLFRKYVTVIGLLVGGSVLLSGAVQVYTSYEQSREALQRIQLEQAAAAAAKIDAFVRGTETQLRWVIAPVGLGDIAVQDRRSGYERLILQEPSVTDLSYLDANGRERLSVSRVAVTVLDSGLDLSREAKFTQPRTGRTYFGPVYFRGGSEPYLTVSLAERSGGVTVAEVNLKFILDVVAPIKVGQAGHAYVVDGAGQLIAHPDISLVLRRNDLSALPQVRSAVADRTAPGRSALVATDAAGRAVLTAYQRVDPPGWAVFVEQPRDEAFAPLYEALARSAILLAAALALAALAGSFLARTMVRPIRALQEAASRMGAGALDQRIALQTGDELEALGAEFDGMAARLRDSYATLEQKVIDRTRELADANERLREATLAKSRFLANMSHELRTPLNAIIGFSDVLLQRMTGELTPKQLEYIRDISDSGKHQLSLINDILDLSKVEAGRMELDLSVFPTEKVARSALALVREQAVRRAIRLELSIDPAAGTVRADERKLKQIIVNLLANAVKFTPDGGRIELAARRLDASIEIAVRDTGQGISPEDQARIFEEFAQAQAGGFTQEGTGLGLTLAQRFVALHGGRIRVESEIGRGSTFTFTLPLDPVLEPPAPSVAVVAGTERRSSVE